MTTQHLPTSITDIPHGKSVEWERLEFKQGWKEMNDGFTGNFSY